MSFYDYESEINPIYFGLDLDGNWWGTMIDLKKCSIDELRELYREHLGKLEDLRRNEPAKKRGEKNRYRFWIKQTHDLRDFLNKIAEEINLRQRQDSNIRQSSN